MPSYADPFLEPGALARHPVAWTKVTANFEHAGKRVTDAGVARLIYERQDPRT